MFYIIRIILGCIIGCCLILFLKRIMYGCQWYIAISVSVLSAVIVTTLLVFIPLENAFITFDSPEAAFRYSSAYRTDVKLVVTGDQSDLVVGNNANTDVLLIIPKKSTGWEVGLGQNTKRVGEYLTAGIVINVYQYKNTDDYYISVFDTNGGSALITDSYDSAFLPICWDSDTMQKSYTMYYAYVPKYSMEYHLDVNGITVISKTADSALP